MTDASEGEEEGSSSLTQRSYDNGSLQQSPHYIALYSLKKWFLDILLELQPHYSLYGLIPKWILFSNFLEVLEWSVCSYYPLACFKNLIMLGYINILIVCKVGYELVFDLIKCLNLDLERVIHPLHLISRHPCYCKLIFL